MSVEMLRMTRQKAVHVVSPDPYPGLRLRCLHHRQARRRRMRLAPPRGGALKTIAKVLRFVVRLA